MRRTRSPLVLALALQLLCWAFEAEAQQRMYHIAYLAGGAPPSDGLPPRALREALRDLGYVEGTNVRYSGRWAEAKRERLPGLAAELVALKVDLIVTLGSAALEAAKLATPSIPIITAGAGDVVETGLVTSLARPGANITGITDQAVELSAKRLELLKEAVPKATRIAVLWNPEGRAMTLRYQQIERAARVLSLALRPLGVREPNDFETAFAAMTRERPDALFLVTDALTTLNRRRVLDFAAAHRIPAMYEFHFLVEDGGLMSYGPSFDDNHRRAASYVDRILKGARPGDLPIEQPTRYYLYVNLKTARTLGLTISPSLLLRADQIIE